VATGVNIRVGTGNSTTGDPVDMILGNIAASGTLHVTNNNGAILQEFGTSLNVAGLSGFYSTILNGAKILR
jgi:hypothetical protein